MRYLFHSLTELKISILANTLNYLLGAKIYPQIPFELNKIFFLNTLNNLRGFIALFYSVYAVSVSVKVTLILILLLILVTTNDFFQKKKGFRVKATKCKEVSILKLNL